MRETAVSATSLGKRGVPFELSDEIFMLCANSDISAIEVNLPFGYDFFGIDFEYLNALSKKYNVRLWSYHLPFSDYFDPSALDKTEGDKALEDFKRLIKNASKSDIKCVVIHPSAEITIAENRGVRMENAIVRLSRLADYADLFGIEVAVETLPRMCLGNCTAEIEELISLNSKLKVCFDVNHIELGTQKEFAEKLGSRIVTLHISDYVVTDDHLLPFEGKIDWKGLITVLNKINYNGPFLYEASIYTKENVMRDVRLYHKLHKKIEDLAD